MGDNKTKPTDSSITDFINAVTDANKRADSWTLVDMITRITGFPPVMWGPSIIGFGSYHYRYDSGREGDSPLAGFSPRKDSIVVYTAVFDGREHLLSSLGKHKTGKCCVYIKRLSDIDIEVLGQLVAASMEHVQRMYT